MSLWSDVKGSLESGDAEASLRSDAEVSLQNKWK